MKYNKLGITDIEVSEICLGTMTFGEQNTISDAHEQLDFALDHEVNFIDTAEMYAVPGRKETQGLTEQYIGDWIQKSGKRNNIILATKATGSSAGLLHIADNLGFSKSRLEDAIHKSLNRLQTDYIDLYQLHWPERNNNRFGQLGWDHKKEVEWQYNLNEAIHTLNEFIKAGKIRHYGISNESPWGLMKYLMEADGQYMQRPVSVQNPYNLLNRTYEIGMAEISYREQIGLLAYSPLGFGLLSGKYHKNIDSASDRLNQFKQMSRYASSQCYEATAKYLDLAEKHNLSLAQMSIAYLATKPWIMSIIIGATTLDQLKENIDATKLTLDTEVIAGIEHIHQQIPNPAP